MMVPMTGVSDHFQVTTADLVAHAGEVDRIGDGLAVAARAGDIVRLDTTAYGQLCQVVPALLNELQRSMIDGMTTAAASAHDTADSLRLVAASYDLADGNAAGRLHGTR
jgi:hypothetical protein